METKAGTSSDKTVPETVPDTPPPKLKVVTYPTENKCSVILQQLNDQRRDGDFCDAQIKLSDSKTIYAHKSLLAACSPYFEGMFLSTFVEATSDVINLSHVTENSEILENVINTFYGGSFLINEANVGETLNLATMLLLDDLKHVCSCVLGVIVSIHNVADVINMAVNYDLEDLRDAIVPVLQSRFHDYVLFQYDELVEMNVKSFSFMISKINTKFVSRKEEFLSLLLKWYTYCEGDERADTLIEAIKQIDFKVTRKVFKSIEKEVKEIIEHLDDVNSDISEEVGDKLKTALLSLNPKHRRDAHDIPIINEMDEGSRDGEPEQFSDSDCEEDTKPAFLHLSLRMKITVRTEAEGWTEEEEKDWKRAYKEMARKEQHRQWAKEWPIDPFNELKTHDNPDRPKKIIYESRPDVHKTRKLKVKSADELLMESKLTNVVVVMAPCADFVDGKMLDIDNGVANDFMEICAYVPGKKSWYKLGSFSAASIQKAFGSHTRTFPEQSQIKEEAKNRRDSDGEDMEGFEDMMDMYGGPPEMMMMMMDMPSSVRRRMMERGDMPPSMMRRMMKRGDRDDDDMPSRAHMMMMREASRARRYMGYGIGGKRTGLPSLTDKKWKMVYFRQKLYFYHQEFCENLFCYDLFSQEWSETGLKVHGTDNHPGALDGLDLIVMGGTTLYAVARFAEYEPRRGWHRRYNDEDEEQTQDIQVYFKVFRMGENSSGPWEMVIQSGNNHVFLKVDRIPKEKRRHRHSYMEEMMDEMPFFRQAGTFKSVLFEEDEEKLNIFLYKCEKERRDEKVFPTYKMSACDIIYLDLKENESMIDTPHNKMYLREPICLMNDSLVIFLNDEFVGDVRYELVKPGRSHRIEDYGSGKPETKSEFMESLKSYPKCPTIIANNSRSLWIMRGNIDNTSTMTEVTVACCMRTKNMRIDRASHPAPPFRVFSLACTGKIDRTVLRTLPPPPKYLHLDV